MALPANVGDISAAVSEARKTGNAVPMRDIGRRMREASTGDQPDSPPADAEDSPSSGETTTDEASAESSTASAEAAEAAPAKRRGKGSDARIQQLLSERKQMRRELDSLKREVDTIRTGSARQSREDAFAELLGTAPAKPRGEQDPSETADQGLQLRFQKAQALAAVNLAREEIDEDHPGVDPIAAREAARLLAAARLRGMAMTSRQAVAAAQATLDDEDDELDATPTTEDAGSVPARSRSTRSSPSGKTGVTRAEQTPEAKSQQEINDIRKQLLNPRLHPAARGRLNASLWTLTGRR